MNSLVIVLFLSGMVAMIMLRTLHKDIARYNQVDTGVSLYAVNTPMMKKQTITDVITKRMHHASHGNCHMYHAGLPNDVSDTARLHLICIMICTS